MRSFGVLYVLRSEVIYIKHVMFDKEILQCYLEFIRYNNTLMNVGHVKSKRKCALYCFYYTEYRLHAYMYFFLLIN